MIAATNISKTYRLGRVEVPVLRGASVAADDGEWVAVLGASGSGKSTLLHLLGGLDRPDPGSGEIRFGETVLGSLGSSGLDRFRRTRVGFVFQFFHLLPELTVLENVLLGSMVGRGRLGFVRERASLTKRADGLIDVVGLSHRRTHRPAELSGGERQRVAIARALMNDPPVVLADEPTGNLDQVTGGGVLDALSTLRESPGGGRPRTMIMVTHDPGVAERADRVVRIADGVVQAEPSRAEAQAE
ncbi:MAG: ABC transporter ATP-binding protein [Planctomycetota bacterium]